MAWTLGLSLIPPWQAVSETPMERSVGTCVCWLDPLANQGWAEGSHYQEPDLGQALFLGLKGLISTLVSSIFHHHQLHSLLPLTDIIDPCDPVYETVDPALPERNEIEV